MKPNDPDEARRSRSLQPDVGTRKEDMDMDKSAIEYGQAPAQWDTASIAGKVAELEKQKDDLLRLCGEILATLKVNRERETLITISQEHSGKFDSWVAAWWIRFNECSNTDLRGGKAVPSK